MNVKKLSDYLLSCYHGNGGYMCAIGQNEPLFFWKTSDEAVYPLDYRLSDDGRISLSAAEDEAWEKYGQNGKVMIELEGELKEFR